MRELYGSRFIFKVTKDNKYQTYLEDKEHDAFPEERNNFSQEYDPPTELDIVGPLVNTESETVFRRMNTSLGETEDLLERLKRKRQQRKVADMAKSDVEILKLIAGEENGELCRKATCRVNKDCVAPAFGFKNYGANCYINATLQCLLCIPEMNAYFLERQYNNSSVHAKKSSFPVCDLVADLYDKAFSESTREWVAPRSLVKICPPGQQDAHEFLWKRLVQKIQNETNIPNKKQRKDGLTGKESWEWYRGTHSSIFDALFGGLYENQVECKTCGYRSQTFDPFLDVSVAAQRRTLAGCLEQCFASEELSRKELYRCEKCRKPVAAVKRLKVFKPPAYLLIHLKRLIGASRKISAFIQYPAVLDISSLCSNKDHEAKYRLVALCVHSGGASSGHYYAFGRRGEKVWKIVNVVVQV